ncbi:hypothetical protein TNCV_138881 [Trichonephila clavipes]|nr:hypothetical protein TNCV_138881 [Trichonephila clavipes]
MIATVCECGSDMVAVLFRPHLYFPQCVTAQYHNLGGHCVRQQNLWKKETQPSRGLGLLQSLLSETNDILTDDFSDEEILVSLPFLHGHPMFFISRTMPEYTHITYMSERALQDVQGILWFHSTLTYHQLNMSSTSLVAHFDDLPPPPSEDDSWHMMCCFWIGVNSGPPADRIEVALTLCYKYSNTLTNTTLTSANSEL